MSFPVWAEQHHPFTTGCTYFNMKFSCCTKGKFYTKSVLLYTLAVYKKGGRYANDFGIKSQKVNCYWASNRQGVFIQNMYYNLQYQNTLRILLQKKCMDTKIWVHLLPLNPRPVQKERDRRNLFMLNGHFIMH